MKTLIFILAFFFFFLTVSAQTRVEIKALVVDIPDATSKQGMFTCDSCYIILEDCSLKISEEFFSIKISERMREIPEGYELFFLFDTNKKVGVVHIFSEEKISRTSSWVDQKPLTVFYSPKY